MPASARPFAVTAVAAALLALTALAAPAAAQSLVQLYEAAHQHDAALQSARAQMDAAQARAAQARAGLLPQAGLNLGASRTHSDVNLGGADHGRAFGQYQAALAASQPLYRPASRIAWQQGKHLAEAAQAQWTAAGQDLVVRVAQAYFDVLAAQDAVTLARALKAAVAQQREAAHQHFEAGNATITDSREAEARHDLAHAQEVAADNELRVARLALEQLTGRSGVAPRPLATPVALPAPQPDSADAWAALAASVHPALHQARLALDVARLETDKAKTGHLPTVELQASYAWQHYPDGNPAISPAPFARYRARNATLGVTVNVPLFAGFAVQNRVRETLSLQDKARADLENAERQVTQATRAAFHGVQSALAQVKALEAAEQSSLTALEANRTGYEVGVRINIDVLNAQSQLYQTRRDLARARYAALTGLLRLKQASGTLQPRDLQPINALLAP
ncbi:channel protein TolC [Comamonadaceae bacterium OH2545_COT-014]|nr:channel protein TolC [Comamonadaceae bacterium OH2545_COT-014]